jgi:protocatechuate 3,4-dioxygenase beta subunit
MSFQGFHPRTLSPLLLIFVLLTSVAVVVPNSLQAAGTITGNVFRDLNANGADDGVNEIGVANVTTTAYDSTGAIQGTATTDINGNYTLVAGGIGPYRVEFSNLPVGYYSSAQGAGSGSTVQFVPDGNSTNVNLGINHPADFCQNNPLLCTSVHVNGTNNAIAPTQSMVRFNYNNTGITPVPTAIANKADTGATWGIAYSRQSKTLFTSAFVRRHVGLGPNGIGAIYQIPNANTVAGAPTLLIDLATVPGINLGSIGTNAARGLAAPATPNQDPTAFDAVGKIGLGDIDISDDGSMLYVINLNQHSLISLPTSSPSAVNISSHPIPTSACPGTSSRPFATKVYRDKVYIGLICDGSSGGIAALKAVVLEFDPSDTSFGQVFEMPLTFTRGQATTGCGVNDPIAGRWNVWTDTFNSKVLCFGSYVYPQPMLTDIEFDVDGSMVLGFSDRFGYQSGYANYGTTDLGLYTSASGGDIIRVYRDPVLGFVAESNGSAGPLIGGGVGNSEGPGGGEFYREDIAVALHEESSQGGLAIHPSRNQVATTALDAVNNAYTSGVIYYNNNNGSRDHAYQLIPSTAPAYQGKAQGLGDLEILCDEAPLEIGNRVWLDNNNNGVQDPGEPAIAGVTVTLHDSAGNLIASAITDANGYYLFSSGTGTTSASAVYTLAALTPESDFSLRIDTGQAVLDDLLATTPNYNGAAGDIHDSDGDTTLVAGFSSVNFTTGTAGQNNHTYDFGFAPEDPKFSLGNRVWLDTNNDGQISGGEVGVDGVSVSLFLDANGDGTPDSATPLASMTTADGGYYRFDNLHPTTYVVRVDPANFIVGGPLASYTSSTPTVATPDNNVDSDDNGINNAAPATNGILSGPVTLGPIADEPLNEADLSPTGQGEPDAQANMTVDFGFYRLSVGNQLWIDSDNSGAINGGENGTPLSGVRVELYDGATLVAVTTTNATGAYLFDRQTDANGVPNGLGLAPSNNYTVHIPAGEFTAGEPLEGYTSSTGATAGTDSQDNGIDAADPSSTGISSAVFSLQPGSATGGASVDNPSGSTNNPTLDFGFYREFSLGNRVWFDTNNDGQISSGEVAVDGVLVNLFLDANGDGTPDSATPLASMTTADGGYYRFDNLLASTYLVQVDPANFAAGGPLAGYTSSDPTSATPNDNTDSDDNGINNAAPATNGILSGPVTLGPLTDEPTGESDLSPSGQGEPDAQANMTVDFGFYRLMVGNQLWLDNDNDGILDAGEVGTLFAGVRVELYDGATLVAVTTTDANGSYLFDGQTDGTGVPNGLGLAPSANYTVRIPASEFALGEPLAPFFSSTGATAGTDSQDNGIDVPNLAATGISSAIFSLQPGSATGGASVDNPTATTHNPTLDFGFYTLSLGNLVWLDSNNNGLVDTGENGISGVPVNLYRDNDNDGVPDGPAIATTTTNATGHYLFTGLSADTYIVEIVPPADYISSTGTNGSATGPYEGVATPDPDTVATDNDDNGTTSGAVIRSAPVTLTVGGEPTGESPSTGLTDPAPDTSSNLTVDFGLFRPVRLGNLVWRDVNNNGLVDAGEQGIANVMVELLDSTGTNVLATTTTDANGLYLFDNLMPGDYIVRIPASNFATGGPLEDLATSTGANGSATGAYEPAPDPDNNVDNDDNGSLVSGAVVSAPVTLSLNGEPDTGVDGDDTYGNLTVDFGFFEPASLGDYVWYDTTLNGVQDSGENGVSGVTVTLHNAADNSVVATTTTDANGAYLFDNLIPGDYYVIFSNLPAGYGFVPADQGGNDTLDSDANPITGRTGNYTLVAGQHEPTVDAGITQTNSLRLGNLVWADYNDNGQVDAGEPGIVGVTVELMDGTGTTVLATTVTNANGNYLFSNLNPGDYVVRIPASQFGAGTVLENWSSSSGGGAYEPAADPDTNTSDNRDNGSTQGSGAVQSLPITLSLLGEPDSAVDGDDRNGNLTVDFGFVPQLASLGNYVWYDSIRNNVQDPTEVGVPGVTVRLLDSTGTEIATTTTDASGYYLFDNLLPDTYSVVFDLPAGYHFVSQDVGGDDALDSDANPTTGATIQTVLTAGENDLTWDAGIYQPASIGDLVWYDSNGNGVQDSGEPRMPSVTVHLLDNNGTIVDTTTTDSNGNYLFDQLEPGNYAIEVVPPAGYGITTQDSGSDASDSDVDPTTGRTIVTTLAPGEDDRTWDAGLVGIMSLGNLVWNDINNNGVVDAGEPGISGVTVHLLNSSGTVLATTTTDANGNYLFSNLIPGDYMVEIDPPAGYVTSTGTNGSATGPYEGAPDPDNDINNDDNGTLNGSVIRSAVVTLSPNSEPINDGDTNANSNLTVDFGLYQPASLGDRVWHDQNENGIQDAGEPGVPNVTVTLYDGAGTVVATTTTDSTGSYSFDNLAPGTYSVGFSNLPPTLDRFTLRDQGTDDGQDSDADPVTGRTQPITLASGEQNTSIDAGIHSTTPSAITLNGFVAKWQAGKLVVSWSTSSERETWGFYVLRSTDGSRANATRVHSSLVLGEGRGGQGASYQLVDESAQAGVTYHYWLEEIELDGSRHIYGPFLLQSQQPAANYSILLPLVRR